MSRATDRADFLLAFTVADDHDGRVEAVAEASPDVVAGVLASALKAVADISHDLLQLQLTVTEVREREKP